MLFSAIGILIVLVVLFGVFLFFARRILRLAFKLAFVGAIVFLLLLGVMIGWWRGWYLPGSPVRQINNRATSSNTRPTR